MQTGDCRTGQSWGSRREEGEVLVHQTPHWIVSKLKWQESRDVSLHQPLSILPRRWSVYSIKEPPYNKAVYFSLLKVSSALDIFYVIINSAIEDTSLQCGHLNLPGMAKLTIWSASAPVKKVISESQLLVNSKNISLQMTQFLDDYRIYKFQTFF